MNQCIIIGPLSTTFAFPQSVSNLKRIKRDHCQINNCVLLETFYWEVIDRPENVIKKILCFWAREIDSHFLYEEELEKCCIQCLLKQLAGRAYWLFPFLFAVYWIFMFRHLISISPYLIIKKQPSCICHILIFFSSLQLPTQLWLEGNNIDPFETEDLNHFIIFQINWRK